MTVSSRAALFAAVRAQRERIRSLEAEQLVTIAALCDAYSGLDGHTDELADQVLHGEQLVFPGADGTPGITEFFHLELALSLACSPESAQIWTADVLNLRHRHPILWQHAIAAEIPVWVAREVSRKALHLSFTQAREFDSDWAPRMTGWTPGRIIATTQTRVALILNQDKETARQAARKLRRVEITPALVPGIADLTATLDTEAAAHLSGTLDSIAQVLRAGGSTGTRDELRAEALGHLAHPDRARRLLAPSLVGGASVTPTGDVITRDGEIATPDPERCHHGAELVVHVTARDLENRRGGDATRLGPLTIEHLGQLLGQCDGKITVRPVVDLNEPAVTNIYQPSEELAWRVTHRDQRVMFPHSNRSARGRGIDLDHTVPWPAGGTALDNLGSLTRTIHRAKTHGGYRLTQESNGVFHWRTPTGQEAWVTPHGSWSHPPPRSLGNDPRMTTSRIETLLSRAIDAGEQQLVRERLEDQRAPQRRHQRVSLP